IGIHLAGREKEFRGHRRPGRPKLQKNEPNVHYKRAEKVDRLKHQYRSTGKRITDKLAVAELKQHDVLFRSVVDPVKSVSQGRPLLRKNEQREAEEKKLRALAQKKQA